MKKIKSREEIKRMVDEVFSDKSDKYRNELIEQLSPENKVAILEHNIQVLQEIENMTTPLAYDAIKTKRQRTEGGRNSQGLEAEERQLRDTWMQKEINRLCLGRGLTYTSAVEHLLKHWTNNSFKKVSRTTIINRTIDPTKK